jgi:hypothetical protein
MVGRAIDDKSPDTLVVVSGEGFWTGSSTLPHLHHFFARRRWPWCQDTQLLLAGAATDATSRRVFTVPAVSVLRPRA